MSASIRHPAVAGRFYPNDPKALLRDVRSYTVESGTKLRALGCVVPHAGYMYSGHVAGAVYAQMALPKRFVILCPNHTGMGQPLAIMSAGGWLTPLGEVPADTALAEALKSNCALLREDSSAHRAEHALEVQLPFLQSLVPQFTFVPITLGIGAYEPLVQLGEALAATLRGVDDEVLIIASRDMNHYESDAATRKKDARAIERILALDVQGLYRVIVDENVTMCGYGPAIAMITAARQRGAKTATLVKYATSGDISGDRDMVVGYAGVIVS